MIEIIGVRFKANGKVYYFSPATTSFKQVTLWSWKRQRDGMRRSHYPQQNHSASCRCAAAETDSATSQQGRP